MATKLTKLQVGGISTSFATGVAALILGIVQMNAIQVVNEQTRLTGSGAGANTATFYDYDAYMGYTPLTATGGEVSTAYAIAQWDYTESYTGAVLSMCIDVATAPTSNATWVDCVITSVDLDTSTGGTILNNTNLTAGRHCFTPLTNQTGATLTTIGPNQQVACYSSFGTGAGLVGDWNIEYQETELN